MKKLILFLFIISFGMICFGLLFSSAYSEKFIGFGIAILFFLVFPIFSYYRWKDKKIEDYYLNSENLRKFKEKNNL